MTRPVAALTGVTGFLGRRLAGALDAAGYQVRALARRDPETGPGVQVVRGALEDEAALERLVHGADVVVHVAGAIKARDRQGFFAVNAEGARRLAAAAARIAPEARFLLVSSLTAREPQLSDYAASKAAAEAGVRELIAAERLTIARPPAIYGPGDRETLGFFQAASRLPLLPLPGRRDARLALVHVDDAAAQIAVLAGRPGSGAVYVLTDARPEGYGWREVMGAAAAAVGRPNLPLAPLPPQAVLGLGAAIGAFGRIGGNVPILTVGKAREMLHPDWSARPHELAPGLESPRFDLDSGFADAVAWYRDKGWL
jgi:nucleoside-diphosphate-sugar epimerase